MFYGKTVVLLYGYVVWNTLVWQMSTVLIVFLKGYSEFRLTGLPSATELINDYSQGSDPLNSLGPYWERPGRTIVDEHLVAIPDPEAVVPGAFRDFERVYFTGTL